MKNLKVLSIAEAALLKGGVNSLTRDTENQAYNDYVDIQNQSWPDMSPNRATYRNGKYTRTDATRPMPRPSSSGGGSCNRQVAGKGATA